MAVFSRGFLGRRREQVPSLTPGQLQQLQAATTDQPRIHEVTVGADGKASVPVPMRTNDVVLMEITQSP